MNTQEEDGEVQSGSPVPVNRTQESSGLPSYPPLPSAPAPPTNPQQQAWGGLGYPWQFYNQNWQLNGYAPPQQAGFSHNFGQLPYRPPQPQISQPSGIGGMMIQQDGVSDSKVSSSTLTKAERKKAKKTAKKMAAAQKDLQSQPAPAPSGFQTHPWLQTSAPPFTPSVPFKAPLWAPWMSTQGNTMQTSTSKVKHKDPKIMLPAPRPTPEYLAEANMEPIVVDPPQLMLVILDLNGTLLHRPNRKHPTRFLARPFLDQFLQYLFDSFLVMVWSSAKPENVHPLVNSALGPQLRSQLVGVWARDSFGLAPKHYNLNVQVYKDLTKVWAQDAIQIKWPGSSPGKCFGQHNTILIDDSVLKASAQPHNLLQIPEFTATEEQMHSDILKEVAGYLEVARMQDNVSSFMRAKPFEADGSWTREWWELQVSGVGSETTEAQQVIVQRE